MKQRTDVQPPKDKKAVVPPLRPRASNSNSSKSTKTSSSSFGCPPWMKPLSILITIALIFLVIAWYAMDSSDRVIAELDAQRRQLEDRMKPRGDPLPVLRGDEANPDAVARIRAAKPTPLTVVRTNVAALIEESLRVEGAEGATAEREQPIDPMTSCVPQHLSGLRLVQDNFINDETTESLRKVFRRVLDRYGRGGGSGPVSLVDLNLGVVSMGTNFISLHRALEGEVTQKQNRKSSEAIKAPGMTLEDLELYRNTVLKIHRFVSELLFCENPVSYAFPPSPSEETSHRAVNTSWYLIQDGEGMTVANTLCQDDQKSKERAREEGRRSLYLASPSFFSAIRGDGTDSARFGAKTLNDEYWHEHVDRDQYGSFAITTLLYLNTKEEAGSVLTFEGGNFEFGGAVPLTVEPRRGRLLLFTSGAEHPHWVAPVTDGTRFALTTAFTCLYKKGLRQEHGGSPSYLMQRLNDAQSNSNGGGDGKTNTDAVFLEQLDEVLSRLV